MSTTAKQLHHHITLNADTRKDIIWWKTFLPKWNGEAIMYNAHLTLATELNLFTDASASGYGIYYRPRWIAGKWPKYILRNRKYNINVLELLSIYLAVETFANEWQGQRLIFNTDNANITHAWHKLSSPSPNLMCLISHILMTAAINNFSISFQFIPGYTNSIADALSREQYTRFRILAPESSEKPTIPPATAWKWRTSKY